jgi:hypothetical protein
MHWSYKINDAIYFERIMEALHKSTYNMSKIIFMFKLIYYKEFD